jgi:hypothetical protein
MSLGFSFGRSTGRRAVEKTLASIRSKLLPGAIKQQSRLRAKDDGVSDDACDICAESSDHTDCLSSDSQVKYPRDRPTLPCMHGGLGVGL